MKLTIGSSLPISNFSDLILAIEAYESLTATAQDKKTKQEQIAYGREVSRLGATIRKYRAENKVELAVFKDEKLLGIYACTSEVLAVRHFEQLERDRNENGTEFTVYRTFSYNYDHEYVVGLLKNQINPSLDSELNLEDVEMYCSTIEYLYIEDWHDTSYPSMPI